MLATNSLPGCGVGMGVAYSASCSTAGGGIFTLPRLQGKRPESGEGSCVQAQGGHACAGGQGGVNCCEHVCVQCWHAIKKKRIDPHHCTKRLQKPMLGRLWYLQRVGRRKLPGPLPPAGHFLLREAQEKLPDERSRATKLEEDFALGVASAGSGGVSVCVGVRERWEEEQRREQQQPSPPQQRGGLCQTPEGQRPSSFPSDPPDEWRPQVVLDLWRFSVFVFWDSLSV